MLNQIKFLFVVFFLMFSVLYINSEEAVFFNNKMTYYLEGKGYIIKQTQNNGFNTLIVKFPEIKSEKLQIIVIPNFSISAEEVPKDITTLDYVMFKIKQIKLMPGFNNNLSHDDILECNLNNSTNLYIEYLDNRNIMHSVYNVFLVENGVAFHIIFDSTSDLYPSLRGTLENLLNTLQLSIIK